jgi:hypothetical protein
MVGLLVPVSTEALHKAYERLTVAEQSPECSRQGIVGIIIFTLNTAFHLPCEFQNVHSLSEA